MCSILLKCLEKEKKRKKIEQEVSCFFFLSAASLSPLQIFEWWYFRKYGTSFIEQVSVSHLRPLLGGVDSSSPSNTNTSNGDADSSRQSVSGTSGKREGGMGRGQWVGGACPVTFLPQVTEQIS